MQFGFAQPGTLDSSFANKGILIGKGYTGSCRDLLVQKDQKIIAAGEGGYENLGGFLLVRYNNNGTPDISFGNEGRIVTSFENALGNYFRKATLQGDGKILAVGYIYLGSNIGNNIGIARYNDDGRLDSTFGSEGKVTTQIKSDAFPCGIAVQPDNKIVIGGYTSKSGDNGDNNTIFIIRYNNDGSVDKTFGNKGIYQETVLDPINISGFALQPDGKILIGGSYSVSKQQSFFVRRYLNNGSPDIQYGVNGESDYPFPNLSTGLSCIAVQDDGSIIAAGTIFNNFNSHPVFVQFTAQGQTDLSFGKNGIVELKFDNYSSGLNDIVIQPDMKFVAALRNYDLEYPFDTSYFATVRYKANGIIDSSFATNGIQITPLDSYADTYSIALQNDGKIILGGDLYNSSVPAYNFALTRYYGDQQEKNKYVHIKKWLHHHGITWQDKPDNLVNYYSIQRSTNNAGFTEIARIYSNHNSAVQTYEATDYSPANYRVAALSNTGNITYSNTLTLTNTTPSIKLYPNPAKSNIQIEGLPADAKTKLTITDLSGNARIVGTASSNVYTLNISQLNKGCYLLKIQTADEVITKNFIKE